MKDFGGSSNGSSAGELDNAAVSSGSAVSSTTGSGGAMPGGGGAGGIELREMDHKKAIQRGMMGDSRELATNICRQYIRSSSRYVLLDHLPDIGS